MSEVKKVSGNYTVNIKQFCKLLARINDGTVGQGHVDAITAARMVVFVKGKDGEPSVLNDNEAAELIKRGYEQ